MTSLAGLAGATMLLGILVAASGLRRRVITPPQLRGRFTGMELPSPDRLALVAVSAIVTLLISRWPVAALGAGGAAVLFTSPAFRRGVGEADKAEALTTWVEMLRDATGTPRGIEGVLVSTASGAPEMIRPAVTRLARRLPYEPLEDALDDLAVDLDHPAGDLVVTALRLAARSGGREIRVVLDDLATVTREDARMHRRVEVARARPRSDMRAVLVIMTIFVVLFIVAAREYLRPYSSPGGQLVLCLVLACWATAVWTMARLGRGQPVERFFMRPDPEATEPVS